MEEFVLIKMPRCASSPLGLTASGGTPTSSAGRAGRAGRSGRAGHAGRAGRAVLADSWHCTIRVTTAVVVELGTEVKLTTNVEHQALVSDTGSSTLTWVGVRDRDMPANTKTSSPRTPDCETSSRGLYLLFPSMCILSILNPSLPEGGQLPQGAGLHVHDLSQVPLQL